MSEKIEEDFVFVLESRGRALIAVNARDQAAAEEFLLGPEMRAELLQEWRGLPTWDGATPIIIRPATEEESLIWKEWCDEAVDEGVTTPFAPWPVFLSQIEDFFEEPGRMAN